MSPEEPLKRGDRGDRVRQLQAATNRRLKARALCDYAIDEDGSLDAKAIAGVAKAAWALGAMRGTLAKLDHGEVPLGVERMIRNPGRRQDPQKERGRRRMKHMRAARKRRAAEAQRAGSKRARVVQEALKAAANYRANPGAYHYLAGGQANTEYLKPTPRSWRSDCSQFAAAVYKGAGLPSPSNTSHEFASTWTMIKRGRVTSAPRPGDLGMYGPTSAPHHVEVYCGVPGQEFVGHGSAPIDSVTPGRPSFYLTYDFLD
jgi:cell wall-associated NlpC family hydrolase